MPAKFIFLLWVFAIPLWPQGRYSPARQIQELSAVPEAKFSFSVIADRTGAGTDSWDVFDRTVLETNTLRPDFCIVAGDVVEGHSDPVVLSDQWSEAFSHLDSIRVPTLLIPGNHDIANSQSHTVWKERIGKTYYSFDYRGSHFLMLNTEEFQNTGEKGFGSKQLAFAEADIVRNAKAGHFFVFLHQPVWIQNGVFKSQWAKLESLLANAKCTIVAGHVHVLAMKKQTDRTYLILGPAGGRLRLERNPALGLFSQFAWFTVENGQCSIAFIEPGRIYPEKTALDAYDRYLKGLLLIRGLEY